MRCAARASASETEAEHADGEAGGEPEQDEGQQKCERELLVRGEAETGFEDGACLAGDVIPDTEQAFAESRVHETAMLTRRLGTTMTLRTVLPSMYF